MKNEFKKYLFEYFHEGSNWIVEIPAASMEDAQARINKLAWARPVGELVCEVPAGLGIFAKVACWFRNLGWL